MTSAPTPLSDLADYWTAQGGLALGIVGDVRHTVGYHLGRDRIYGPAGLGDLDYSVQQARDKAGLSDAASAIDLGRLGGSYANLRTFSRWLVDQCTNDPDVRRDFREIIYSPDGQKVQRYSGIDNAIHTGAGNGDTSHLTHTHISYFRDSEHRDKVAAFRPYFEEAKMLSFTVLDGPSGTVTVRGSGHSYVRLADGTRHPIAAGDVKHPAHPIKLTVPLAGGTGDRATGYLIGTEAAFVLAVDVTFEPSDAAAWEAWYKEAPAP